MACEPANTGLAKRIAHCRLAVSSAPWAYAERHREAIASYWQKSRMARPKLFDGTVYLMRAYTLADDALSGSMVRTDFKSFLHWREHGYDDAATHDAFGASIIRSAEGYVLLGLQTEGHLNAGVAYPPSGMIDADDVRDGAIDVEASIVRELQEETGLSPAELARAPGYVLTLQGPFVAVGIEWRSPEPAEALRRRILAHNERQAEPELADIVIVRSVADMDSHPLQAHAVPMLRFLLSA